MRLGLRNLDPALKQPLLARRAQGYSTFDSLHLFGDGREASWRDFGLAVGSVICFLAVVMAWYGVNFVLGTGLHSYGFGIGGETYVMTAVALDAVYVAAAVVRYLKVRPRVEASSPELVAPTAI